VNELTFDIGEDFVSVLVVSAVDHSWAAGEADSLQMAQQGEHCG